MRIISFIIFVILMILGVSFAVLNHNAVAFNYYFGSKQISLSLLLVFSLGIGIVIGFLVTIGSIIRLKTEKYRLKSRLKSVEQEVANLRSAPITGP